MTSSNKIRPENLGRMAESFFETLCKDAAFVANRANDDKAGWDYEIEHSLSSSIDYTSRSYPVYRVQVKATSKKSKVPITYSNLLKLIQYNGASFIYLATYSGNMIPDRAYIFHIDENSAKAILKEIREKQLKDQRFSLNKRNKVLGFNEECEIKPLNGKNLKAVFDKYIGTDYLGYVIRKTAYLSKLERAGQTHAFKLQFKKETDFKAMCDCHLGYKKEFKVDTQSYRAPFGIRDKEPYSTVTNHEMMIYPHSETLTVFLKNGEFGNQFKFNGTLFIRPSPLPEAMRIETAFFDFLYYPAAKNPIEMHFKDIYNTDIKVEFKEFYNFLRYLESISDGGKTYLKFENSSKKGFELCLGTTKITTADNFANVVSSIKATYVRLHDLDLDCKLISTGKIWKNLSTFTMLNISGHKYRPAIEFEFNHAGEPNEKIDAVLFHSFIEFEDCTVAFFVAFFGEIKMIRDNVLHGTFHKSQLMGEQIFESTINIEDALEIRSSSFREELTAKGFKVLN